MPRRGGRAALIIAAPLCVTVLPFIMIGELPGQRWLSASDDHAARLSRPLFLLACGAGNAIYAAALVLNGSQLVPGAPVGAGLLLPMLLPMAAWLIWRRFRHMSRQGG